MEREASNTLYTVIIASLKDDAARTRVAQTLAGSGDRISAERISAKLQRLPVTITRQANRRKAIKLKKLLSSLGAEVDVTPPIADVDTADVGETHILPTFEAMSETASEPTPEPAPRPPKARVEPSPAEATDEQITVDMTETAPPPVAPPAAGPAQPLPARPGRAAAEPGWPLMEPLSISGILDRTFQLTRRVFWKLLAIASLPWIIGVFFMGLGVAVFFGAGLQHGMDGWTPTWALVLGLGAGAAFLLVVALLYWLSRAAMIHVISEAYMGREVSFRQAYRFASSRLAKFMLTDLLRWVVVFGLFSICGGVTFAAIWGIALLATDLSSGYAWAALAFTLLVVIPVVTALILVSGYLSMKFLFFDKVIVIEDIGYIDALQRSWRLLAGRAYTGWDSAYFVRLLCLLALFWLLGGAIYFLFQFPGQMAAVALAAIWPKAALVGAVLGQVMSYLGSLVVSVFGGVCMVIFYYDVRIRKEGLDLAMDVANPE